MSSELETVKDVEQSENRYITFKVGGETYGAPLLDVREVVEYQQPKYMPNMENHFLGVINIRGSIVGVVDLRIKFGVPTKESGKPVLLVCESTQGCLAAIVDEVVSVIPISNSDIEESPPVMTRVDQRYLYGVARASDSLVTLVRLREAIGEMKIVSAA